jgi:hypothetical protein
MNAGVPISYVGFHVGPRRMLRLNLRRTWLDGRGVHVNIDGSTHVLPWGPAIFEVPADRPVMISVYTGGDHGSTAGLATAMHMPEHPPVLEYRNGQIGPPGTTRNRSGYFAAGCLVVVGLVTVLVLAIIILAIFGQVFSSGTAG